MNETKTVGFLKIDTLPLKNAILPSPKKCRGIIDHYLPILARQRMDTLILFSQDASGRLEKKPTSTVEFVESLTFLDQIQEKIDNVELDMNVVKELYDLIEQYNVPVPPEDLATYKTLSPSIIAVKNTIDKSVGERDANVDRFCTHLDKDIAALNKEVKEVKEEAQVIFFFCGGREAMCDFSVCFSARLDFGFAIGSDEGVGVFARTFGEVGRSSQEGVHL